MSNSTHTPILMDGKALAGKIREELKGRVESLVNLGVPKPVLATILVGDDPASATYVKMKGKACESVGMGSVKIEMPETTTTEELLAKIEECNAAPDIHGILLQHPVPPQIDERLAFDTIDPAKDADGVTTLGFGRIAFGEPAYPCCTPAGILRLLDEYEIELEGKHAVVVGRSPILGRPVAMMLLHRNCTVTICHSRTRNLPEVVSQGDIVVAAVGKPEFIKGDWIKEGSVIMDAGYNPGNIGDADFEGCSKKASHITPVPGGVGPMTIAMLLSHTVQAAEKSAGVA
ncbi:MAG: bifunctional methylenetetrahydrofolate dehydrogenase/methenyltetrahydrofolate cyclohydrolase [Candidatus Omnitrophica bacterium]|nr:bifunctional methylenetetrahydrofolate dehydrogenase/methenyltetrahydrofolate cyclohydrolase [Candidatus Omnitrophota bacterium]